MSLPILVTGGTGRLGTQVAARLGTQVAARLGGAGAAVRVLTHRRAGSVAVEVAAGDLTTGAGIDAAVAGVGTVAHCAGSAKGDEAMTRAPVSAAQKAGVGHVVFISVAGAGRVPVASAVDLLAASRLSVPRNSCSKAPACPARTCVPRSSRSPCWPWPGWPPSRPSYPLPRACGSSPLPSARLVELALGEPSGPGEEMGGPTAYRADELVLGYLAATRRRRLFVPLPITGKAAAAIRAGANLTPDHAGPRRAGQDVGRAAGSRGLTRAGAICSVRCGAPSRWRPWQQTK